MKSWPVQLWGLALSVSVGFGAGCSVQRAEGEYGVGICSDSADNDADGDIDCGDPDCQAEDVCGRASPLIEPDGGPPAPGPEAGSSAPPPPVSGPPADAGSSVPPEQPRHDAQVNAPPTGDAGAMSPPDEPDPLACEPACAANETCIDRYCVPNEAVFVEIWDVVAVSVKVPRADSSGRCFDASYLCPPKLGDVLRACDCAPDPMVRVSVRRPGEEPKLAFETPAALRSDSHEWKVDEQLLLRGEFEVVLTALDADGLVAEPLFTCSALAEPERLGTGAVSCTKAFDQERSDAPFVAEIRIEVRPGADP